MMTFRPMLAGKLDAPFVLAAGRFPVGAEARRCGPVSS
jgi:hypothetical protein